MRKITSNWLAQKYREKFRLQPSLRLRDLRDIMEKKHNYRPSMSTCVRTQAKALASILGDYSEQFGMIRSYVDELLKKNTGSTVKIQVQTEMHVFKSIDICRGVLKRGFLNGCRRVLSLDGCFLKGP